MVDILLWKDVDRVTIIYLWPHLVIPMVIMWEDLSIGKTFRVKLLEETTEDLEGSVM